MQNPFARKLGAFLALSGDEMSALDRLHGRRKVFPAGRDMVYQGQTNHSAYILASGWVCSYKLLSGGARQIVETPRLATAVLWAASRDEAMVVEHLVVLGGGMRRNAWRIFCWSWAQG